MKAYNSDINKCDLTFDGELFENIEDLSSCTIMKRLKALQNNDQDKKFLKYLQTIQKKIPQFYNFYKNNENLIRKYFNNQDKFIFYIFKSEQKIKKKKLENERPQL